MTDDMLHVMEWHNGDKAFSPFSDAEMTRRQDDVRGWMAQNDVDAALFTSFHCINYYSGWLYCYFGRKYGMVITQDNATTVSAGIDGGQPWRRSFGDNITYTDWRRDNYFRAVRQLTPGVKRLGIEFDHVSLDFRRQLEAALPGVEFVDVAQPSMWMRSIKSAEEHTLIREGARICDVGGAAVAAAVKAGVPEHEVAIASTNAMIREIAAGFPFVELMDTWTWFQSGLNTDGAHNPVTNKKIRSGEILSLNCFPMIFGYYTALELNDMYRQWDLLKYRSFGYGHSFGVLSHYYGREAGVELREDIETELQPGMVVSMEPMVMLPEGVPGAGGYREHDILIVTEDGAENITGFPFGPEHNVIRN